MNRWTFGNNTLHVIQGDLTAMDTDAVVNAANSRLAGGGGVDGAIHRAAGHVRLQRACQDIISRIGSLPPGKAVITPGFDLQAKHIIHTVGPIWQGGDHGEPETLRNAYTNSLHLAQEHDISSIAFPAISCGVYGYPVREAATIALTALADALRRDMIREASMVLHGKEACHAWVDTAQTILPRH